MIFRSILPSFAKKKRRRDSGSDEDPHFMEEKEDEDLLSDRRRSGRGEGKIVDQKVKSNIYFEKKIFFEIYIF